MFFISIIIFVEKEYLFSPPTSYGGSLKPFSCERVDRAMQIFQLLQYILMSLHFKELTSPFRGLMFATAEKEGQYFIILFLSFFCQPLSPRF